MRVRQTKGACLEVDERSGAVSTVCAHRASQLEQCVVAIETALVTARFYAFAMFPPDFVLASLRGIFTARRQCSKKITIMFENEQRRCSKSNNAHRSLLVRRRRMRRAHQ
jgi:hypothetical protein